MKQAKLNCGKDKSDHKTLSRKKKKKKLMIQLYKCDDMYVANWTRLKNLSRLKNFQVIMTNK